MKFVLGVHAHQPVGNFDFVIEDAYQRSYLPFVEVLERHPAIKTAFHYSGVLLAWIAGRHPEFISRLGSMIDRGQVEMLGGGFYEPILAAIPWPDQIGQLKRMQEALGRWFGRPASGAWLTERLWEPEIAVSLADAGFTYAVLDDFHFTAAGFEPGKLYTHFQTETEGRRLGLFPIDEKLRYLVPFRPVEEVMAYLSQLAARPESDCAVLFDDAEKFGMWPGTAQWVYGEGWLDKFFTALAGLPHVHSSSFEDVRGGSPGGGIAYLPTSSYFEMGEWSLPAALSERFADVVREVRGSAEPHAMPFLRGGVWKNFFVKYPESNHLHKRMLQVSQKLRRKGSSEKSAAEDALFQSQCNDVYWHGVFGGLYLPHLRQAAYASLLQAEALVNADDVRHLYLDDFNLDGYAEVIDTSSHRTAVFSPLDGRLIEWSLFRFGTNLGNTLARRPEAYHRRMHDESGSANADTSHASIHDLPRRAGPELQAALVYDQAPRHMFMSRFLATDTQISALRRASAFEPIDLSKTAFTATVERGLIRFQGMGLAGAGAVFDLEKDYAMGHDSIQTNVRLSVRSGKMRLRFGVETNLALRAAYSPLGRYRWESGNGGYGDELTIHTRKIAAEDEVIGACLAYETNVAGDLWIYPIETVSQSESGYEKVYQGSCMLYSWPVELSQGESFGVQVSLSAAPLIRKAEAA